MQQICRLRREIAFGNFSVFLRFDDPVCLRRGEQEREKEREREESNWGLVSGKWRLNVNRKNNQTETVCERASRLPVHLACALEPRSVAWLCPSQGGGCVHRNVSRYEPRGLSLPLAGGLVYNWGLGPGAGPSKRWKVSSGVERLWASS